MFAFLEESLITLNIIDLVNCLPYLFKKSISENFELIFNLSKRRALLINNRLIGELYADNLNETEVSSYNLLNVTYSKQIFNNSEIYLGVNNLFDVNYFDNIRINAFGKRYYEPAPKRNVHLGLNFSF